MTIIVSSNLAVASFLCTWKRHFTENLLGCTAVGRNMLAGSSGNCEAAVNINMFLRNRQIVFPCLEDKNM